MSKPSASPTRADINVRSGAQMLEYISVADRIAAERPARVLDWGCGHGQMSSLLRARGIGIAAYDFRPDLADGRSHPLEKYPEIEALWGHDPIRLPYDADSFDAALSCGVLEHVEDPDGSLDELQRVLKPGGTLYICKLPNRASWTEWIARRMGGRVFFHGLCQYDQLYHLEEARALVERHGFTVTEARYANVLPLLVPVRNALANALWMTNRWLSRVPGLRRVANNVDLIARKR